MVGADARSPLDEADRLIGPGLNVLPSLAALRRWSLPRGSTCLRGYFFEDRFGYANHTTASLLAFLALSFGFCIHRCVGNRLAAGKGASSKIRRRCPRDADRCTGAEALPALRRATRYGRGDGGLNVQSTTGGSFREMTSGSDEPQTHWPARRSIGRLSISTESDASACTYSTNWASRAARISTFAARPRL
jgi:hypothetical protein